METMITLGIAFAVFMLGEIGYLFYHIFKKKKEQEFVFQDIEKGKSTRFSKDELNFIKKEAKRTQKQYHIDDITWNDLDMDEVFMRLDYCLSSAGDQNLYGMLRCPEVDIQKLQERVNIMEVLEKCEDDKKIRSILFRISGQCDSAIDALYHLPSNQVHCEMRIVYCLMIMSVLMIVVVFFIPTMFVYLIPLLILNYIYANALQRKHVYAFVCALHLVRYARAVHALSKCACAKELDTYLPIFETSKALSKIQSSFFDDISSDDGFLLLFAKNVCLSESVFYSRLSKQLLKHKKDILQAVRIIGMVDALLAVSTYQKQISKHCKVTYVNDRSLIASSMLHPLVENCVPNDVNLQKNVLISGSNAAGKSTYLKMIGINAIFAQSFGFALADSYQSDLFRVYTSMALKDSLEAKDSYFVAEVRSIKRMMDAIQGEYPVLCMIDEILRGTNTGERIAAASEILMCFVKKNALCISATHDLELTHIMKNHYQNVHFEEAFEGESMYFTYTIQTGPSNSRNAIKLLKSLAFDTHIIEEANQRREFFELHGKWVDDKKEHVYGAKSI